MHTKEHPQRPASRHPCNPPERPGSHLCKYFLCSTMWLPLHSTIHYWVAMSAMDLPSLLHRRLAAPYYPVSLGYNVCSLHRHICSLHYTVATTLGWGSRAVAECWLVDERHHLPTHTELYSALPNPQIVTSRMCSSGRKTKLDH